MPATQIVEGIIKAIELLHDTGYVDFNTNTQKRNKVYFYYIKAQKHAL